MNRRMRKSTRNASVPKRRKAAWPPNKRRLRELVEEAIIDAYGESEQRTGFLQRSRNICRFLSIPRCWASQSASSESISHLATRSSRSAGAAASVCPFRFSICRCPRCRPPERNGLKRTACGPRACNQRRIQSARLILNALSTFAMVTGRN